MYKIGSKVKKTLLSAMLIGSVIMGGMITGPAAVTGAQTITPAFGDLNSDGQANSTDYSLLKRYILGTINSSSINVGNADLNGDGNINSMDSSLLRRVVLGIIKITPTPAPTPTPTPTATPTMAKIKGSEVLVIGDSFLALSRDIKKDLEAHAKAAGIMDLNDSFRDNSVSGTKLADNNPSPSIPNQYKNGVSSGSIKYVIMDGGGNDCLWGSGPDAAFSALKTLVGQMQTDGIVKVFYVFYPNPVNNSTLQGRLDVLRPQVVSLISQSTLPKGYIVDLRPVFDGKYGQYILSDGIHPTAAGSQAAADAVWDQMQKNNFFSAK